MRSKAHRVDDEVELNPKLGQLTPYILRATRESAVAQSVVRRGGGGSVLCLPCVRVRVAACVVPRSFVSFAIYAFIFFCVCSLLPHSPHTPHEEKAKFPANSEVRRTIVNNVRTLKSSRPWMQDGVPSVFS